MNEELKVIISAEISKLKQGVNDAKSVLNDFKAQVQEASKDVNTKLKSVGDAIGKGLEKGLKVAGAGIVALGTALVGTNALTEEYRINQAKLGAAFEQAGFSASSAKDTYAELYATIGDGDQAAESAANIALLANSEQEAAKWADLASGVLGTFHDTLQPEAFYEAANETMKLGEATGAFTQMLEQTGIMSVDEFNKKLAECSTEAEKQAFMLEVSEQAMGKAGEAYDKATENIQKQREAQTELTDTLSQIGDAISPVITAFTDFANDALAAVMPYIEDLVDTYGPQIEPLLTTMSDLVSDIVTVIVDNIGIIGTIAGIITAIAVAIGLYNVVAAIKNAMAAAEVTTVWGLVAAYAAQAAAMIVALAPYLLIIAAIAAVIAIIVLCVKHWDEIKEAVANAWETIKEKTAAAVDAVVQWFTDMKEKISNKVQEIKDKVREKFEEIKQAISDKIQAAKDNVVNKFTEIKDKVSNKVQEIKDKVKDKFEEIKNNMKDKIDAAKTTVLNIFTSIKDGIQEKINNAKDKVKEAIDKIKDFFNFSWSLPKLKLPHISISGKFSLDPLSVPKFSISWNALGGVFDTPTLFGFGDSLQGLGEDGAEAVVPLEKNLGWLNKLADMLSERLGSDNNTPIILQVDGTTFAQTSIRSINQLTKQTGSLGLVIE